MVDWRTLPKHGWSGEDTGLTDGTCITVGSGAMLNVSEISSLVRQIKWRHWNIYKDGIGCSVDRKVTVIGCRGLGCQYCVVELVTKGKEINTGLLGL